MIDLENNITVFMCENSALTNFKGKLVLRRNFCVKINHEKLEVDPKIYIDDVKKALLGFI